MRAEQWSTPHAFHAEGPVWWPSDGSAVADSLRYVDMMAGRVLTARGDDVEVMDVPGPVAAAVRPRRDGGVLVLTEHGVSLSDSATGGSWRSLAGILSSPDIRFNDGGCSPSGEFYCGSMRYDQAEGGATLYRVRPDGDVAEAYAPVTVSNGIAWTADGSLAYYNDTPTRSTWTFDWTPERGLHKRRQLFRLADDDPAGGPDGLCVDAEGNLWTAIYGGSRVEARSPDGTLIERVELPVSNVTACTFGGADLRTLYVTTTRENVPAGTQPEAGAVFHARPGVAGMPVRPFDG